MGMNDAAANTIYETFTADYTSAVHHAMRADGQWFTRSQSRHPMYGYRWSAWRPSLAPERGRDTGRKARLPR